jgi:catechol-2,3-dioxygenase
VGRLGRFAVTDPLKRIPGDDKTQGRQMIEANGVDHVVLHVGDVGRSKKFYTEILGMTVYREDEGQVFRDPDGHGLQLIVRS